MLVEKRKLSLVLAPAIFVGSMSLAVLGFSRLLPQKGTIDRSDWMSAIDDNTAIKNIDIPGSHDTLARIGLADLSGQCQYLSVEEQLKAGIRYLDLRFELNGEQFKGVHGIVDQRITFDEVNQSIGQFLKEHPSEFLIVSIKDEKKNAPDREAFQNVLKTKMTGDYWSVGTALPEKIGDVRGKAILLSRFQNNDFGIPAYAGWIDDASFSLPNGIYVQDKYKVKDIENKKQNITDCFAFAAPSWRINYLSGYFLSSFPPSYAGGVAKEINPWVTGIFPEKGKRGIVVYDYVTSELLSPFFGEVSA